MASEMSVREQEKVYREIQIPVGDNERKIVRGRQRFFAEVIGPFAIHPSHNLPGYTLTVVESGWAVVTQWPTIDGLRTLADDIIALGLDWSGVTYTRAKQPEFDVVRELLRARRKAADLSDLQATERS